MTEFTEANMSMAITFKLYGDMSDERMAAERKIARHRLEQLSYVRPKMKERPRYLEREERDY